MGGFADFEAFYRAEYAPMVRSLTLAFGNRSTAEDAAQVGFERAYVRWGRVSMMDRPGTWVFVVAVRHARRGRDRATGTRLAADPAPDAGEVATNRGSLIAILRDLPDRQRQAVVLRHLADLSLSEIAEAQGVAVGTVKSCLHAAYARLRADVEGGADALR